MTIWLGLKCKSLLEMKQEFHTRASDTDVLFACNVSSHWNFAVRCVGVCGAARAVLCWVVVLWSCCISGVGPPHRAAAAERPAGRKCRGSAWASRAISTPLSADFTPLPYYSVYCSTSSQTPAGERQRNTDSPPDKSLQISLKISYNSSESRW